MGVQESTEESAPALQILSGLSSQQFDYAMGKLEDLSKKKFEMQVSKWDLLLILSLKSIEVKKVMQLITSKQDPNQVPIHQLMVAMVLCRQKASGQYATVEEKLYKIMQLICFNLEPGMVQRTEVEYLFHLLSQWVEVTTGYKLTDQAVVKKVCSTLYRDTELALVDDIVRTIKALPELIALFEIYQKEKQAPLSIKTNETKKEQSPPVDAANKSQDPQKGSKHVSMRDVMEEPVTATSKTKAESQKEAELARRQQEARLDENLNQLHWNTQVLAVINKTQNSKLHISPSSPQLASKMTKKLQQVRQINQLQIQADTSANLKDLMQRFACIENVNLDIYGQKQLTYMMKSNFFEQSLVNSGFSIRDFVRGNVTFQMETSEMQAFDNIMCRAQAALSFKEFFKQNLSEIKYQQKTHQSRIIYYLTRSGEKNILEKKKHKCVGELNMLNTLLQGVFAAEKHEALKGAAKPADKVAAKPKGDLGHLPISQVKPGLASETKHELFTNEIVPSQDTIFKRIYHEVERLRSCGCSRRDLIKYIDLRDQKTMASKIVSFWQGVLKTLTHANQVRTFAELEYFKEFFIFAQRSLQIEENIYRQLLMEQMEIKNSFNDYTMQVGKLKALHLALQYSQSPREEFVMSLKHRIAAICLQLEKLDISLIEVIHSQVLKKRSQKLFFISVGQLASYKCISKGLNYERSIDYLGLNVCRYRMWKLMGLVCNQDKSKLMERKVVEEKKLDAEMYKQVFIMAKMQEIDTYFNLEAGSTESARQDRMFDNFSEVCEQIANEELVHSQQPEVPILPDEKDSGCKDLPETVIKIMRNFYQRHRVDLHLFKNFQEFVNTIQSTGFELDGKLNFATEDLKNAGVVIFDFIDIEEKFLESNDKKRGDDILLWAASLSCSLAATSFEQRTTQLASAISQSHVGCQQYANKLTMFPEQDFLDHFKNQRAVVYNNFITVLRAINKGYYFNCFDILNFALPLECSIQNNYWCAQAIQMCLNQAEKDEKFQQLIQVNSPVLLSRRSTYLNVNIASQLILAAFKLGPQSVRESENESLEGEDKDYEKDRADFMEQYKMTRGEQHEKTRIKLMMFNDVYEQGKCILRQAEIEQSEVNNLLQVKDANKTIPMVVSHMYDKVYKLQDEFNMAELAQNYEQLKLDQLEGLKKQAIQGIFSGGLNFIESLIRLQTNENTFGSNITMTQFKDNIDICYKELLKVQEQSDSDKVTLAQQTRNPANIMTSDSNRTDKSYHSISLNKTVVKKVNKRNTAKKKVTLAPLQKCESDIIETLAKTAFLYRLIKMAGEEQDAKKFYEQLSIEQETRHRYIERLKSVLVFLRVNLNRDETEAFVYQGVNEQEMGCRLMQNVQAGILVNPVFVYSPHDANKLGIPPLSLQLKDTSKNDNLLSVSQQKAKPLPQSPASRGSISNKKTPLSHQKEPEEETKTLQAPEKPQELTYSQKAANLLLQFLNQVCLMDDKITAKQILKNDTLFGFLELMRIQISEQEAHINLRENIEKGLTQLVNVFEVQKTPLDFYLTKYERVCKFIQRDLIKNIQKTDEGHLKFYFFDIMSKKGSALVKQTINKVDVYFSLAQISDADKLEFSNAHGKIKRELDQNLRTFKEFLDLEENKKVAQSHESLLKHQELRLIQEISSLVLLVRIYYLKQIELQQPI